MKNKAIEDQKADQASGAAQGSAAVEREKRQWWAVADGDVREVTGYSCAPSSPNVWWCPEVGFSGTEGHHLFVTEAEALDKALDKLREEAAKILDRIDLLRARRQNDALSGGATKI